MSVQFDYSRCIKCAKCVLSCPSYALEFDKDKGPLLKYPEVCIVCGHCVAVCPESAVRHTDMDMGNFPEIRQHNITYDMLFNLIRVRRSRRRYSKKPLSEEHINKIAEAIRYIPTAENDQSLKYILINNRETMDNIRKKMNSLFTLTKLAKPFLDKRNKRHVEIIPRKYKIGKENLKEDPYLRTAPAMLIIYGKKNDLRMWDAAIASAYVMLVCETLGIGTVWNGVFTIMANMSRKLRRIAGVPKGHKVLAAVCMGYPVLEYKKYVDRKKPDFKILEP